MVVRAENRKHLMLRDRGLVYELLVPNLQRSLSMLLIELPPEFSNEHQPFAHEGEECEFVLEGRVEAHVGEREVLLNAGDSISFNSSIAHWFRSFEERVVIVSAMTPPSF
jgi:quercetin dioxygenase-like cupin family protein